MVKPEHIIVILGAIIVVLLVITFENFLDSARTKAELGLNSTIQNATAKGFQIGYIYRNNEQLNELQQYNFTEVITIDPNTNLTYGLKLIPEGSWVKLKQQGATS